MSQKEQGSIHDLSNTKIPQLSHIWCFPTNSTVSKENGFNQMGEWRVKIY